MSEPERLLLVCEQGIAWRRRLRPRLPSVTLWEETDPGRLPDCAALHPRAPWLLVCQEETLEATLRAVWARDHRVPLSCVLVVLPAHLSRHAGWFRQAGAAWVQTDWREWDAVVRVCERHWRRCTPRALDLREQFWRRLPWEV